MHSLFMMVAALMALTHVATAEDYGFSMPSYTSLRGGVADVDSYSVALSSGITLAKNRIFGFSLESVTMPSSVAEGTLSLNSASLFLTTDPLRDWSFQGAIDGWTSEDAVSAYGARGAATWTGNRWMLTFEYGLQQITFAELPVVLWDDRTSTVSENTVLLMADVQLSRHFSARASHRMHWYNAPMKDYAEGLRTRFIAAEVLNIAGTLTEEDTDFGFTYSRNTWHAGIDATTTVSSLDELRTNGIGLRVGYRLQKKWSVEVQGARYESENSETDSNPLHTFNSTVSYSW